MEVVIDKRTELIGVIFQISDYYILNPKLGQNISSTQEYRNKIIKNFEKFNTHNTIKLFNKIIKNLNCNYDAPISLILSLDNNYKIKNLDHYTFKERLNSEKIVVDFLKSIERFVIDSDFEKYYNSNKEFYQKCTDMASIDLKKYNIDQLINIVYKDYYKNEKKIVNLMPFSTCCNFGNTCDGRAFPCISVDNESIDLRFNTYRINLIIHEFGHPVINPLTAKYSDIIKDIKYPTDVIDLLKSIGYKGIETIINEYVVEAVSIVVLKSIASTESYNKNIYFNKSLGFVDIEWFVDYIFSNLNFVNNYKKLLSDYVLYKSKK